MSLTALQVHVSPYDPLAVSAPTNYCKSTSYIAEPVRIGAVLPLRRKRLLEGGASLHPGNQHTHPHSTENPNAIAAGWDWFIDGSASTPPILCMEAEIPSGIALDCTDTNTYDDLLCL